MNIKINERIVEFFKDIYGVDVSNVKCTTEDVSKGNQIGTKLMGYFDRIHKNVVISSDLTGFTFESTLVHELNHYIQNEHNLSMTIDITKANGYYKFDDGFETLSLSDLTELDEEEMIEEFGENDYYNMRLEIDSRVVQAIYEYRYGNIEATKFFISNEVFRCGFTNNLYNAINDLNDDSQYLFINEWKRINAAGSKVNEGELEAALDSLLEELDM